jgi:16S rRNA processing protein RimM
MEDLLRVGVISSTHGLKGEVKVYPTTDDAERFRVLKTVIMQTKSGHMTLEVESVRFFKQFVIMKFKEIQSIEEAEAYKGNDLLVTRQDAVPLEEGEYFITDLIGLTVKTEQGEELGRLIDVLQTGANDVYVIKMETGRELLLPAIRQCILDVDLEGGKMRVHVLEGLMDL